MKKIIFDDEPRLPVKDIYSGGDYFFGAELSGEKYMLMPSTSEGLIGLSFFDKDGTMIPDAFSDDIEELILFAHEKNAIIYAFNAPSDLITWFMKKEKKKKK